MGKWFAKGYEPKTNDQLEQDQKDREAKRAAELAKQAADARKHNPYLR